MKLQQILLEMPAREPCPHCGHLIADWFREWYESESEQPMIYKGEKKAADCPHCHLGVKLAVIVGKADPIVPILARSRTAAENWVLQQKAGIYRNLNHFLQSNDPAAPDYRNYTFRA